MKNSPAPKPPSPPKGLSDEAKRWWKRITSEFTVVDGPGMLTLQTALESFCEMRAAQEIIEREGASIRDRFGQPKPHPLLTNVRDSRAAMLAALKQLNFDLGTVANDPWARPKPKIKPFEWPPEKT